VVVTHARSVAARAHRTLLMADGKVVDEVVNERGCDGETTQDGGDGNDEIEPPQDEGSEA